MIGSRSRGARGRSGSLALLLTLVALWVAYFFRDPERTGARGEQLVIAPADGKVVMITEVDEPTFVQGARDARLDLHERLQRAREPVSGERHGATRRAQARASSSTPRAEESSLENEQTSVGIEAGARRMLVRQIAGLIARRIITDAAGRRARACRASAWASFASARASTSSFPASEVRVKVGERHPCAGTTVLAELPAK